MLLLRLARLARRLRARRSVGFTAVVVLLGIALVGNAVTYHTFDGPADPDISWGDSFWYSLISITTVGYGDYYAKSTGARVGTVVFVVVFGLTSFSLFFGMVVDWMAVTIAKAQKGLGRAMARDHILIIHFPSERRVRQIIDEIRCHPRYRRSEIVIVSAELDELPFVLDNVIFVRGSTHDIETYERAHAAHSKMAVILSPNYADPNSDAIVAAAASVLDRLKSDIHIVCECVDERHRYLFDACGTDSVVSSMSIAGNLLVQEAQYPGVAQMLEHVTSQTQGTHLYSADVLTEGVEYLRLAKALLDHDVNLLAVNRGRESLTSLRGLSSRPGDQVVYAADAELDWPALIAKGAP